LGDTRPIGGESGAGRECLRALPGRPPAARIIAADKASLRARMHFPNVPVLAATPLYPVGKRDITVVQRKPLRAFVWIAVFVFGLFGAVCRSQEAVADLIIEILEHLRLVTGILTLAH
jgi:hypothetical protein